MVALCDLLPERTAIGVLHGAIAQCKGYYGGFGLMDIGTHIINALRRPPGALPAGVRHRVYRRPPDHPRRTSCCAPAGMGVVAGEHLTATLTYAGGVTATILHHRLDKVYGAGTTELLGTTGRIALPIHRLLVARPAAPGPAGRRPGLGTAGARRARLRPQPGGLARRRVVRRRVRAGPGRRPRPTSRGAGDMGACVLEVMLAILESAAYLRPVELPQAERDHPLLRWRRQQHGLVRPPGGAAPLPRLAAGRGPAPRRS